MRGIEKWENREGGVVAGEEGAGVCQAGQTAAASHPSLYVSPLTVALF